MGFSDTIIGDALSDTGGEFVTSQSGRLRQCSKV